MQREAPYYGARHRRHLLRRRWPGRGCAATPRGRATWGRRRHLPRPRCWGWRGRCCRWWARQQSWPRGRRGRGRTCDGERGRGRGQKQSGWDGLQAPAAAPPPPPPPPPVVAGEHSAAFPVRHTLPPRAPHLSLSTRRRTWAAPSLKGCARTICCPARRFSDTDASLRYLCGAAAATKGLWATKEACMAQDCRFSRYSVCDSELVTCGTAIKTWEPRCCSRLHYRSTVDELAHCAVQQVLVCSSDHTDDHCLAAGGVR